MVLQELGGKLTAALHKMQSVTVVSEEVVKAMLKDIAAALLEADVRALCGSRLAARRRESRRERAA